MSGKLKGRRYLSVAEFAAATGMTPEAVRKRCQRGALRCRKTGSRWRVWVGETEPVRPA